MMMQTLSALSVCHRGKLKASTSSLKIKESNKPNLVPVHQSMQKLWRFVYEVALIFITLPEMDKTYKCVSIKFSIIMCSYIILILVAKI